MRECGSAGVLECWSFECWNAGMGSRFSVLGSRFSVFGFRFSVLGFWFLVLGSRLSVLGGEALGAWRWGRLECCMFECWNAGMGVDFWRWLIRKPFRLGLVGGLPLPG
jgi:hypothetical protein